MHELALTKSILDIAVSEAEKRKFGRVLSIKLRIGEFSGVVPQFIQNYYDIVSRGTVAENAKLIVEKIPVSIRCNSCGVVSTVDRTHIRCPECGKNDITMLTGREFYVESLEVE